MKQDSMMKRNNEIARLIGGNNKDLRELNALREFYRAWREFHEECADPEADDESKIKASEAMCERAEAVHAVMYVQH